MSRCRLEDIEATSRREVLRVLWFEPWGCDSTERLARRLAAEESPGSPQANSLKLPDLLEFRLPALE